MRELDPGARRALGDDVPAPYGARPHPSDPCHQAGRAHRRRRLRPESGARGVRAARGGRRFSRARRRRSNVPRSRAAAGSRSDRRCAADSRPVSVHDGRTFRARAGAPRQSPRRRPIALPNRAARVLERLYVPRAGRSTSSRRRAAAPTTAASARSSRCAAATSTPSISTRVLADIADARAPRRPRHLHRRRQRDAQRRAVRGAVPRDRRRRASTTFTIWCRR